jgi:hypothetical protein
VPQLGAFEVEMAIENLKSHKPPGADQIPTEFINQGVEQFTLGSINLLIQLGISKNCLRIGIS